MLEILLFCNAEALPEILNCGSVVLVTYREKYNGYSVYIPQASEELAEYVDNDKRYRIIFAGN